MSAIINWMMFVTTLAITFIPHNQTKGGDSIDTLLLRPSKDYALFFAVDEYDNMFDLNSPIFNAQEIASTLSSRYGFDTVVVRNPTFSDIEYWLNYYHEMFANKNSSSDEQLLIFFSGHGISVGGNGYFMPKDGDSKRPYATAMEYDFFRSKINDINCKHILVAIDACHAISFDPDYGDNRDGGNKPKFSRPNEPADQEIENHHQYDARIFLTSDAKDDKTPDRSKFAEQFLKGLRTHYSEKGYITAYELDALYLKKVDPIPGTGYFGKNQTGSNFIFFSNDEAIGKAKNDQKAWEEAKQEDKIPAYDAYIRAYPDSEYVVLAEKKIRKLKRERADFEAYQKVKQNNTLEECNKYLLNFPEGNFYEVVYDMKRKLLINAYVELQDIEGGSYEMGDFLNPVPEKDELPHRVSVKSFSMSKYEVTVESYLAFAKSVDKHYPEWYGNNNTEHKGYYNQMGNVLSDKKSPIVGISWYDAIAYCNWLSIKMYLQPVYLIDGDKVTPNWNANGFRLPTEAEWEYAARNRGKKDIYAWGNGFKSVNANEQMSTDAYTFLAPIDSNQQGELFLCNMTGNVWEWCWDWYATDYYRKSQDATNPDGPLSGYHKIIRGGAYTSGPKDAYTFNRTSGAPNMKYADVGFRVVRSITQ